MSDKEKKTAKEVSSQTSKSVAKSASKKDNFFSRIGKFLKEYRGELKKISWPTFPEVVKNTLITLAVVLIIGIFIWVFDLVLSTVRDLVLTRDDANTNVSDTINDVVDNDVTSIADILDNVSSTDE